MVLSCLLLASTTSAFAIGPFFDDFESGLGQWTGRANGPHSGDLVLDPVGAGHGQVLCFTNFGSGGDTFMSNPITLAGPVVIGFDYLGLPGLGGVPGDLGGFVGIAYTLTATTEGTDLFWLAATQDSYPGLLVNLEDDGTWHHYSFVLDASAIPAFHVMLEDYIGSGGVTCDAFFDNVSVTPVPEPAVTALALLGLLSVASRRSRRQP